MAAGRLSFLHKRKFPVIVAAKTQNVEQEEMSWQRSSGRNLICLDKHNMQPARTTPSAPPYWVHTRISFEGLVNIRLVCASSLMFGNSWLRVYALHIPFFFFFNHIKWWSSVNVATKKTKKNTDLFSLWTLSFLWLMFLSKHTKPLLF